MCMNYFKEIREGAMDKRQDIVGQPWEVLTYPPKLSIQLMFKGGETAFQNQFLQKPTNRTWPIQDGRE